LQTNHFHEQRAMTQKNFFLLLNLSADPPENDSKIIEAAIRKKQTEWSRVRNHPTKGIQAKLFLDLIPEIRKVMLNPELRKKEALKAKKQKNLKNKLKESGIDRHLSIYFAKGSVTDEEIKKLQTLHSVEVEAILRRVLHKEKELETIPSSVPGTAKNSGTREEKLAAIDKSLGIQMRKGYITDEEISKLAEAYAIDKGEIAGRTNYPVLKNVLPTDVRPKTLDKTIETVINRNLTLLGKPSLYAFLDLPVSSDLGSLKSRAETLRAEAIASSQKNAIVTASAELAGHCSTIFKSEKTRTAYDVSKALADLNAFNTDIEVAEMDGVICAEYFEALHKNATDLGMGPDEASDYIEAYCRDKNWILKTKEKRRRQITIYAAAAASVFVVIAGSIFLYQVLKHNRLKSEYQTVIAGVKEQKQLENKRDLWSAYLDSQDRGSFASKAEKKLKQIQIGIKKRNAIDSRHYKIAMAEAAAFHEAKAYEKAGKQYKVYLKKHPNGHHAAEIKQLAAAIPDLIDDRDFQNLNAVPKKNFDQRITAYATYLADHPGGKYRDQVEKLISNMSRDYYNYISRNLKKYEKEKNWSECIRLCDNYLSFYKESDRAVDIKAERYYFQKQLDNSQLLGQLIMEASRMGGNYSKAKKVYTDYLGANPDSPIKYEVKKKIAKLDKRRSKYR